MKNFQLCFNVCLGVEYMERFSYWLIHFIIFIFRHLVFALISVHVTHIQPIPRPKIMRFMFFLVFATNYRKNTQFEKKKKKSVA